MTRRISRHKDFSLTLDVGNDAFLRTPRDSQRNWILKRVLKEAAEELVHCDSRVPLMIAGQDSVIDFESRSKGAPGKDEIMEDWQIPVMERMAEIVTTEQGSILEVGFGRGVASEYIQSHQPLQHTIVECNKYICNACNDWIQAQPERDIRQVEGKWQDVLGQLDIYDGILFHTYPMDEQDFLENVGKSSNFVEHFFGSACRLLKPGGHLSYLTLEADSLGRAHQRALFKYFSSFTLSKMTSLEVPTDTQDALWYSELVIVDVVK